MATESQQEPQETPAQGKEDFWALSSTPPSAGPAPELVQPSASSKSARTWIIAGAAVVVVAAVGAFFLVGRGGSSVKTTSAAATANASNSASNGQGRRGGGTAGTLASVKGSTLTITTQAGQTVKVTTSSSTNVTKAETGTLGDVKVGDMVVATGTKDASGNLAAARVMDQGVRQAPNRRPGNGFRGGNGANGGPGGPGANGNGAFGTVKSVSGSTLLLTGFDGTDVTVTTAGSTTFTVLRTVKLIDLSVGQPVVVRGATNSDGSVSATSVQQGGGFGGRRGGFGGGGNGGQGADAPQGA